MENALQKLLRESKNFAQSASNSVAANVSAPVDGLAWLLKKAGVPMPTNPMGGSDWMAGKGLTRPANQNSLSGLLGEFAGLAGPMVATAKAPQIANGLLGMADNLAAPRTMNPQTGAVLVDQPVARQSSMEWTGKNTPQGIGQGHASDMMQLLKEDIATKDFNPSGVRQALIDWSSQSQIHPRYSLQEFTRALNVDKELTAAQKGKIFDALNPQ